MGQQQYTILGPEKSIMTVADVCAELGIKTRALRELIRDGKFPHGRMIAGKLSWTGLEFACYLILAGRWYPDTVDKPKKPQKKTGGSES